jgi:hypothetical protein
MARSHAPRPQNRRAPPLPSEAGLQLPHERDESPQPETSGAHGPRDGIRQAARDVERGLVDTEARGTPSNVPGPVRRGRRWTRARGRRA